MTVTHSKGAFVKDLDVFEELSECHGAQQTRQCRTSLRRATQARLRLAENKWVQGCTLVIESPISFCKRSFSPQNTQKRV